MPEKHDAVLAGKNDQERGHFRYCQTEDCKYKMAVENTAQEKDAETPEPISA